MYKVTVAPNNSTLTTDITHIKESRTFRYIPYKTDL